MGIVTCEFAWLEYVDHEFPEKRFVVLRVKACRALPAQDSCLPGKETKLSYSN